MLNLFKRMTRTIRLFALTLTLFPAIPVLADTCDIALDYCKEECRAMYSGDNYIDAVAKSGCYGGCYIAWSACKMGLLFE